MATRIKGKGALFTLGATDFGPECTSIVLENEDADADVTTFADAAAGGAKQWFFTISAVQSTDATSLWRYLWDNAGDLDVAFVYAPHGNAVVTASLPHYTGTVDLPAKPSIGGDADTTYTFEVRIDVNGEPVLDTVP